MYEVKKTFEVSGAHQLSLNYQSKCSNLHGHNWHITITCQRENLDENGMVFDFGKIKSTISDKIDHKNLNGLIIVNGTELNPTAENIAYWISLEIGDCCTEVMIEESDGNVAIWRK